MKISHEKPPNWEILVARFGVSWGNVVVTYGDTIHCKATLPPDLLAHESVHIEQQKNPEEWWKRYMEDTTFRREQEIAGYKAQMKYLKTVLKNRNDLHRVRVRIACALSGYQYGHCISYDEAFKAIG